MGDSGSSQARAGADSLVSFADTSCANVGSVLASMMGEANPQEYLYATTEVRVWLQTKLYRRDSSVPLLNSRELA